MEDLKVTDEVTIPAADLREEFSTSGGPGGQHANRSQTAVTLAVDLDTCGGLTDRLRARAVDRLGPGDVMVTVAESRSQWRNRKLARQALSETLEQALKPPPPKRKKTKPSRAARRRRLEEKRRRGEIKKGRGRIDPPG